MKTLLSISILLIILISRSNTTMLTCDLTTGLFTTECIEEFDEIEDLYACILLGGTLKNETCEDIGKLSGSCCFDGVCSMMTSFVCESVMEGMWNEGVSCEDSCPSEHSCCVDGGCESWDEETCDAAGGAYFPYGCQHDKCVFYDKPVGACCDYNEACYELPEVLCLYQWVEGLPCEPSTCNVPPPNGVIPINVSSPGRCCETNCYDDTPVDKCNRLYEYGAACYYDYPCYPIGVCLKDGLCLENMPKRTCQFGTWFEGGDCNNYGNGSCYTGEYNCNNMPKGVCDKIDNSTYVPGEACPIFYGACCGCENDVGSCGELVCEVTANTGCNLLTSTFTVNATCDDVHCEIFSCCAGGFVCLETGGSSCIPDSYLMDGICPYTGTCTGNDVYLENSDISVSATVRIIDVEITSKNANIEMTNFSASSTKIHNKNSTYVIRTDFSASNVSFDLDSTENQISVEGVFSIDLSDLNIALTTADLERLTNNNITIASYSGIRGQFSTASVSVDGEENKCVTLSVGPTSLFLHQLEACSGSGTSQSPGETSGSKSIFPFLAVSLLISFF